MNSYLVESVKLLSHIRLFTIPWTVAYQGSFIHRIFQARVLEWVAISFSRGSSQPGDRTQVSCIAGIPGGSDGTESACDAGDLGLISGLGRSLGEGSGNPLQYSCLENPMNRAAWWSTVHQVNKDSDKTERLSLHNLEVWGAISTAVGHPVS